MIDGCIGFGYVHRWLFIGSMLLCRGKHVVEVRLPYGIYHLMVRLWRSENILGKILFKKSKNEFGSLENR